MTSMRYLAIFIASLGAAAFQASALPTSTYATSSRLADGHWVKIKTTAEGIHALSYQDLKDLGFSNPQAVQVYGYGAATLVGLDHAFSASAPDDIAPVATLHSNGRLLFFGQSDWYATTSRVKDKYSSVNVRRNFYDTASYYFLSDCGGSVPVPEVPFFDVATSTPITSHIHMDVVEEDLHNPTAGGMSWFGQKYERGKSAEYNFNIRHYAPTATMPCGSFTYLFGVKHSMLTGTVALSASMSEGAVALSGSANQGNTSILPVENSQILYQPASGHIYFTPMMGGDGNVDLSFKVSIPSLKEITYAAADRVALRYPRANTLDSQNPSLIFNYSLEDARSGQNVAVTGAPAGDLQVWCIDAPNDVYSLPVTYDAASRTHTYTLVAATTQRTIAFIPSANWPKPQIVGTVTPQNLHAMPTPDMAIVCTADMLPQAERLAQLHRTHQGMDVAVIEHNQIFNEFSGGARDADAYRRMAKMFYDRNPQKFKYLLFAGSTYYDNRSITCPAADRLVCYTQDQASLLNTNILNYSPDSFFGMLNDDYRHANIHMNLMQVAVGRIPCKYPSELTAYVNKVQRYFEQPMSASNYISATIAAGGGDNGTHSAQGSDLDSIMRVNNRYLNRNANFIELFEKKSNSYVRNIKEALSNGTSMFVYCGHGSPTSIQGWTNKDVLSTPYSGMPFTIFASCDQFDFDHLTPGIMATMLMTENGGSICGIGSGRGVYLSANPLSVNSFCEAYAKAAPGSTYGDMFVEARKIAVSRQNTVTSILRNYRNYLSYNFAGDPALPIPIPSLQAPLTTVNGLDAKQPVSVNALSDVAFQGIVADADGNADASFNGTATINVYDGLCYKATESLAAEANYKKSVIPFDSELLASVSVPVVAGHYSGSVIIPPAARAGKSNKVIVTATSDDNRNAIFRADNISVADFVPTPDNGIENPADAPRVLSMQVANATVRAVIDPSASGLSMRGSDVYSAPRFTLDNTTFIPVLSSMIKRDADGNTVVEAQLPNLTDGLHTVGLNVVNNLGMAHSMAIDFSTARTPAALPITVAEENVRTTATFACAQASEPVRLTITDSRGNTVHSAPTPELPYCWDLSDNSGATVPDGRYTATLLLPDGQHASTNFTVLK